MTRSPAARWATSFADLALLLLGFFILLYAGKADVRAVAASAREALGSDQPAGGFIFDRPGADLFEPGEARLTDSAREALVAIGRNAARDGKSVRIESLGRDPAARRFDGWELAAARAAAAARAVREGGVAEEKVEIVVPARDGDGAAHRLVVRLV